VPRRQGAGCHSIRISPSLSTLRASALAGLRLQVGVYFASVQKQSPGYGPGCTLKLCLFVCLCVCVRIRVTSSWRHCADVTAACNRRWANTRANMLRWPSVRLSVCPSVSGCVWSSNTHKQPTSFSRPVACYPNHRDEFMHMHVQICTLRRGTMADTLTRWSRSVVWAFQHQQEFCTHTQMSTRENTRNSHRTNKGILTSKTQTSMWYTCMSDICLFI